MWVLAVERLPTRLLGTPFHTLDTPAHALMPGSAVPSRPRIMDHTAGRRAVAPQSPCSESGSASAAVDSAYACRVPCAASSLCLFTPGAEV